VQDAGHELKTPVATIQLTAENLAEDVKGDAEKSESVAIILRNAERMSRLVSDMLTLAKMEVARSNVKLSRISLKPVIERAQEEFAPRFEMAGKKLEVQITDDTPVYGDSESLYHLFSNLIENALKYSEMGASVKV